MRKIKIFLTMLAVAGVLFATSSCVDNTESESVAALRNAKASELTAQAQYLRDKAAIEKTYADAAAALTNAQAVTEAAQQEYIRAQAALLKAQADGEALRAAADAAKTNAEADKLKAEAYKIESEAKTAADEAAEELRVQQAKNEVIIANEAAKLAAAAVDAKVTLLDAQILYLKAASTLQTEVATQYAALIEDLTEVLNDIADKEADIEDYKLTIASAELALATYSIDSARFVRRYIASLKADSAKRALDLKYAERSLQLWESFDTGLKGLEEAKAKYIQDTLDALEALEEAIAQKAVLLEDTVAKKADLVAVTPAYEAAVAGLEAAQDKVNAVQGKLDTLLSLTSVEAENITISSSYSNVTSITHKGESYNANDLLAGVQPSLHKYDDGSYSLSYYTYRSIYEDGALKTRIYLNKFDYFDNLGNYTGNNIYWNVSDYNEKYYNYDYQYAALPLLDYAIEEQKEKVAQNLKALDEAALNLQNAIDTLTKYVPREWAAKPIYEAANAANTEAREKYEAEWDNFVNTPDTDKDTVKLNTLWGKYNGWQMTSGGPVLLATLYASSTKKDSTDTKAVYDFAYNTVYDLKDDVQGYIQTHIRKKLEYDYSVLTLEKLVEYRPILEDGSTRDKLVIALNDAQKALVTYESSDAYNDAVKAYDDASDSLQVSKERYELFVSVEPEGVLVQAENAYNTAVLEYKENIEYVEFQISNGGTAYLLKAKENKLVDITGRIAYLEAELAKIDLALANVLDAPDTNFGQTVAEVIEGYKARIAEYKAKIVTATRELAELNQKAAYRQAAFDAFMAAFNEVTTGE
jgi:hypothetical protein